MPTLLLEAVLVSCLSLAFLGDILQSVTRVSVSVLGVPNLATHLVTLSMLVNRFGGALALLLIGFSIDTGVRPQELIVTYGLTVLIVGLCYFLAALWGGRILHLTASFVRVYYKVEPPVPPHTVKPVFTSAGRFDLTFIYIITICGFLMPSVLAAVYPDYRGALLQSGFLINSIATLYTALKIEKDIAMDLISDDDATKWRSLVRFLMSRAYACVAGAAGFAALYVVLG